MTSPPRRRRRPQLTPPVLGLSVHKVFNDPKADVVLKCRVQGRYRNSAEIPEQAFKVQKSKLQAHSSIFQDMFELANPMNETFEGLPFVKLAETATTMEVVLGFVYNLPKPVRKVQELDWTETRAVWEAANKYEMYTLRNFASDRLALVESST